jgi:hypothetical protein
MGPNFVSRRKTKERVAEVGVIININHGRDTVESDSKGIRRAPFTTVTNPKLHRVR